MKENNLENNILSLAEASAEEKAHAIFNILNDKKGINIQVFHVPEVSEITDYVILATGTSSTHIQTMAGELEFKMSQYGAGPDHMEGRDNNAWIVLDFSHVIVHIMSRDAREFYSLEKLYGEVEPLDFRPAEETEEKE